MAHMAFAGTVDSLSYRRDGKYVVTDVRFRSVRFARSGLRDTTFVLSIWGGREKGKITEVSIAPTFAIGERYIVLATGHGSTADWYLPIAGVASGCFRVQGEKTEAAVVCDWSDRPVVSVIGDHLAVVEEGSSAKPQRGPRRIVRIIAPPREPGSRHLVALEIYPAELDPGTRVTESQMLEAIRELSR